MFERLAGASSQARHIKSAPRVARLDVASALAHLAAERTTRGQVDDSHAFSSKAAAIPSSSRRVARRRSPPTIATCRRRRIRMPAASGCSPAPTWRANRRSCGRTRDRNSRADGQLRAGASMRISALSTACSPASARPTISRADARPSWSRWWRPPPFSTRPASARLSSSMKSAAAPRPSTDCRLPGRRSNTCTT